MRPSDAALFRADRCGGYQINGIWQDVYLLALPKIHLEDVYVKPLVSKNNTGNRSNSSEPDREKKTDVQLQGNICEWVNCAGTDVNSAPRSELDAW